MILIKNQTNLFPADTSIINADLSKSTLDLFSPPKSKQHAQTLLFGPSSEEQSSEDEIGTKNSILSSPPYTRYFYKKYFFKGRALT